METVADPIGGIDSGHGEVMILGPLFRLSRLLRLLDVGDHVLKGVHDCTDERRRILPVDRILGDLAVRRAGNLGDGHGHPRRKPSHLARTLALLLALETLRLGTGVADVKLFGFVPLAARDGGLRIRLMAQFTLHRACIIPKLAPNAEKRSQRPDRKPTASATALSVSAERQICFMVISDVRSLPDGEKIGIGPQTTASSRSTRSFA